MGIKPSGSDFCASSISLRILTGNKGVFGMLCSSDSPFHVNSIPVDWSDLMIIFKSFGVSQYRLISIQEGYSCIVDVFPILQC